MYTEIVNQRNAYWKSKSEAYSKNPNVRNLEKSRGVTVYSDEELNRLQNVQSLAEMQYWEKIRYLYNVLIGINKPPEDGMYDPDVFNHGVSLYNGRFDRDSDIFKSLMNTIVNYYSKGLGVQYVQCGDDLYSIGSKDDLDISSEKNEKNGIYDFTQSFKSLDCNLFVHTRDNMTMILYVVLNKGDIESRTSFTTIKPFPEVK